MRSTGIGAVVPEGGTQTGMGHSAAGRDDGIPGSGTMTRPCAHGMGWGEEVESDGDDRAGSGPGGSPGFWTPAHARQVVTVASVRARMTPPIP